MTNILFCGIGGQGVLTASEICCTAALLQGCHVKKSEVHGMAQRGGSVESHVRISGREEPIYSPLIMPRNADFLVCFHAGEAKRLSRYLKPAGIDFLAYLEAFNTERLDRRFLNTYCLGVLSAFLTLDVEHWISALNTVFRRAREQNREVFENGRRLGLAESKRRTASG